jgi:small subunit ribosomal protein S20
MPHTLSAKKRVRQGLKLQEKNRAEKSRIRTVRRAFLKALETNDLAAAHEKLKACTKLLHRAANSGPVHLNTAARTIGRMQSRLAALEKAAASK